MTIRRKVIHISTVHYWQDARILDKECFSLAKAGYNVSLFIQHDGDIKRCGVKLIGLPVAKTKFQRLFSTGPRMLWEVCKRPSKAILHLHDPELLLIGWFFKILGFKVIYDVHEDLPKDISAKNWIPKIIRKPLSYITRQLEFILTAPLDGVVTVTPTIQRRFTHVKNVLVRNFPKLDLFLNNKPALAKEYVIYVGDIRMIRGAKEMVLAMQNANDLDLKLKLGGRIYPNDFRKELLQIDKAGRVEFLGWVSHYKIPEVLGKALCGLVVLHPSGGYEEAFPVKLFEYMASGIPVIASDFPVWRKIIEEADCGLMVNPKKPEEIAKAINYLNENPDEANRLGENGRKAAKEYYSWEQEEKKLIQFYREVAAAF